MSILDGIYWEEQYKKEEELRIKKETNQKKQDDFNGKMPCKNCKIKDMCKYAFSVEFKDYNKEMFSIDITCKNIM